ncbi:zinc carboxypeptidase A 1 [Calliopsis andreniformis]|uniref:zinc carboxypeptidase A 1 n=1 Tax=Calliopsis andreniformis TaxID=337506 RepID=UPI003FCDA4E0
MIAPAKLQEFMKISNTTRINSELMMDDVQKYIDVENPRGNLKETFNWLGYHRLDSIYRWLDSLVTQHPEIVKPITGGMSYEGRRIRGVKLSYKEGNPGVFIEGGIHAREWISPAVVTYILNELILSDDPRVRYMAESYDWYIFPVFNPDGYEYTHTTNRLWRKTRRPTGRGCIGADPNRNWNFHWAEGGTSPYPCSEIYPGDRPFSETETRTMSQYIHSIHDKIFSYIAFHSYSQLLLIPYGHTNAKLDNYNDLFQIGNYSVQALAKKYGTRYKVGNIVDVIYVASGGSMDWVRGTYKTPITFTYELRDTGRYGFILPASQIIPTAEETLESLVAMFQQAAKLGYGLRSIMWKLIFIGLVALAAAEKAKFDNYKVYRVVPRTEEQLAVVRSLEDMSDSYSFWKDPSVVDNIVDVMVAPHKVPDFIQMMEKFEIEYETFINDVQTLIDNEKPAIQPMAAFDLNNYHRLNEIYAYLDSLAKAYPGKVQVIAPGKTYEGRQIKGVKLSFGGNKPGVFLEAGIHAREWIGPATILYMLNELLHSNDPEVRHLAESHEWYIFPVFNPDGYEYTHTTNRMWRKTRKPYGSLCKGSDPNRNWGYKWMSGGASSSPCADTYAGSSAFSDIETKSMSEYIQSISNKFYAYVAFHSYSQLLMFPYGHTRDHLENYKEELQIGQKTIQAIAKRYGTKYQTGNIAETIYIASGSSMDWVKGTFHKPVTFTYELRDTGRYGFLLPANQIAPTALETLDSLVAMFKEAKARGYE